MPGAFIDRLLAMPCRRIVRRRGEALFRAGDPVRGLHVVLSGAVELVRHGPGGERIVLQRAGAGDALAEASIHALRYHCDAIAAEDCAADLAPRAAIEAALETGDLARDMAAYLARRIQRLRGQVELLSRRGVGARLEGWLALNDGAAPPAGGWVAVAREIAVTPEALYRELARRRRAGDSRQRQSR
ncbi:MAG: Crp/Fnr family transcriptional regulator [Methylobacteriaceae bacterium]|nr:Crp/Fnr family transcriptional regulator [Methylobacteriaceae bacterium]